jgi:hypothetical protein
MKNYIGIVKDHSASMRPHVNLARRDYHNLVADIKEETQKHGIDTIVSVVKCGVGFKATVQREIVNSSITTLRPAQSYITDGHATPLWDSVGELIKIFEAVPDLENREVSFLLSIITDGQENNSKRWDSLQLRNKILELQATDRWSFIFRVPYGYATLLQDLLGVPAGNILEWEQTERGWGEATQRTSIGLHNYYSGLHSGTTSTNKFFADTSNLKIVDIKREMKDISREVTIWQVSHPSVIRDFIEEKTQKPYIKGTVYYELVKTETVQDHKNLIIRKKDSTGAVYAGHAARHLLGLPDYGNIRLAPKNHGAGAWEIFIQSTSVNRVLPSGTKVLLKMRK